jgi:hypothetical protein
MTWGETASDNVKSNGQRDNKVAARALTSIELFDVSSLTRRLFTHKLIFTRSIFVFTLYTPRFKFISRRG